MKYHVFYHSADHDGFGSMYLINKYLTSLDVTLGEIDREFVENYLNIIDEYIQLPRPISKPDIINIPYNYGQKIDREFENIQPDDIVIFVDCLAYGKTDSVTVLDIARKVLAGHVYIFDHHKTAIDWMKEDGNRSILKERKVNIFTSQDPGISAIYIIWKVLFRNSYIPAVPRWVELISQYDTWFKSNNNWYTEIYPFQQWLRYQASLSFMYDYKKPESAKDLFDLFDKVPSAGYKKIFEDGMTISDTLTSRDLSVWKATGFIASVHIPEYSDKPFTAAICSDYLQSSSIFEHATDYEFLSENVKVYILLTYGFKAKIKDGDTTKYGGYKLSVYSKSDEYSAEDIARSLGGGGHIGAASAPFGIPKRIEINRIESVEEDTEHPAYEVLMTNRHA